MITEKELRTLIEDTVNRTIPVGTIIIYSSPSCPDGYLPCDGREIPQSLYPELYKVIGNTFGGNSKTFCLPDLQGKFIRGWDKEGDVDPERAFGILQEDAIQGHCHNFNENALKTTYDGYHTHEVYFRTEERGKFGSKDFSMRWVDSYKKDDGYEEKTGGGGTHKHSIEIESNPIGNINSSSYGSIEGKVDTETRPINIALLYCIKVK